MTALENATQFFHACEGLAGWVACATLTAPGALRRGRWFAKAQKKPSGASVPLKMTFFTCW